MRNQGTRDEGTKAFRTPRLRARRWLLCARVLFLAAVIGGPAQAQSWNVQTGGDWGGPGNWTGMMVPDNGAAATLGNVLTAPATITVGQKYTLNSLTIDSASAYTIQQSGAKGTLVFVRNAGQQEPTIQVGADNSAANVIAVPIGMQGPRTLTVDNEGSARLTISGAISGNAGATLKLTGPGQTYLTGTNTYGGLTDINRGNVAINNDAALGAAGTPIDISNGGTLQGLGGNVTIAKGRDITIFRSLIFGPPDATLAGDDANPNNILQVDGKISNGRNLVGGDNARLGILNSVRLTNQANNFGGADTPIFIGNDTTAGRLYLASDKVLGNAGNNLEITKGGLVAEGSFDSSRKISIALSATINVVNKNDTVNWNGAISGGRLVKDGPGTLGLGGTNTYSRTRIEGGTVMVSKDSNLGKAGGAIFIANGAVLRITDSFTSNRPLQIGTSSNPSSATISIFDGKTWTENGSISGGELIVKGGELKLTSNNSQSKTNIVLGSLSVSNDGQLGRAGAAVQLTFSGQLHVTDTFTTGRPFTLGRGHLQGINVDADKTLTITSGLTEAPKTGGSFTKFGDGTLVFAKGSNSTVLGSTTVNAGTLQIDGVYDASKPPFGGLRNKDGKIIGTGVIKGTFNNMKQVAAGDNAPGTLTVAGHAVMNPGSSFGFNINSAVGQAGGAIGWGLLAVEGSMDLLGTHVVALDTLTLDGQPGPIAPGLWDPSQTYLWEFAAASDGIFGFDPSEFTVDPSGFLSPVAPDHAFSVEQIGNGLYIEYAAVPEPPSWFLGLGAALLIGAARGAGGWAARPRRGKSSNSDDRGHHLEGPGEPP